MAYRVRGRGRGRGRGRRDLEGLDDEVLIKGKDDKGKGKGKDDFAQHGENSWEFLKDKGKQVFIIVCIFVNVNHNSIISMGCYYYSYQGR